MTPELLSAIIGLFMPVVVEFIKKYTADKSWLNYTISIGVSAVVGVFSMWIGGTLGSFAPEELLETIGAALVASQSVYVYWFKNSQLSKRIAG